MSKATEPSGWSQGDSLGQPERLSPWGLLPRSPVAPGPPTPHSPPAGQDLLIISTDESQVFVAVQEWCQTDTYNLYQSDPRGVHYVLVLEGVRSSRQAEEDVVIDILEVGRARGGGANGQGMGIHPHPTLPPCP